MYVLIREEKEKDYKAIYEVTRIAFGQENESRLIDRIRISGNFVPQLSLVAEIDNKVVGHILLSRIRIISSNIFETLALSPMSVIPELQNLGIGSELVKKALKKAKELGFDSIIVIGHKDFYPRFGFKRASRWKIKCSFNVSDESFMAIELTDNALKSKAGTVQYPDEFIDEP